MNKPITNSQYMNDNRFLGSDLHEKSIQERILKEGSAYYFDRDKHKLSIYLIEGFKVLAESKEDAAVIYGKVIFNQATK
jgi:hypothetical protein